MNGVHSKSRTFIPCLILATLLFPSCAAADSRDSSRSEITLAEIEKAFSIKTITAPQFPRDTHGGKIDGSSAGAKALEHYIALFGAEFTLYPPDLIKRTQLKSVVFCENLSFAGQRRSAIPDFKHDALYLDVSRASKDKTYMRKVIHHEFFHIIDYRDDGELYRDDRWSALNAADFKYGSGGRNAQDMATTSVLTDKFPGFLNHYSTTGVEEDKAEMFANMMVDFAYVQDRTAKDPVLEAKVRRMKELLVSFCPDMNDAFWVKVSKTKRAE